MEESSGTELLENIGCIVVGVEDSPSAFKALRYATGLAVREDAELVIVEILEYEDVNVFQALNHRAMKNARESLARRLDGYRKYAIEHGVKNVRLMSGEGDPAKCILRDILSAVPADLLVIGQHSKNRLASYFGSTAKELVYHSPISVMVVK